ncbi:hypothetical protein L6452_21719 [Arctium lappa]|uniref:Uncharacterized protein n=1 Tax=Arctium lappa TaxID=4217 RepID=A0ACB9B267_ARCLA|nr:hypothetical protein L6452_21719 [Arctium lappa]
MKVGLKKEKKKVGARKYHPDVSPPGRAEEYTQRFIRVQEAYETLSDPSPSSLLGVADHRQRCRHHSAGSILSISTYSFSAVAFLTSLWYCHLKVGLKKEKKKVGARKYHPDVSPPGRAEEYTQRFIRVQEAYETLSDPSPSSLLGVADHRQRCRHHSAGSILSISTYSFSAVAFLIDMRFGGGYVRCKKFEDAVGVYLRMREEEILRPDEATVVSTLSACIALKNLELGKEIHRYVTHELGFTTIIGNALLDMYCKCGCLDVAREIFDGLPKKNVICWTSMVSGYVSCGQLDDARLLFDRSPTKDIVLWTAMINGYVQFNDVDEAMTLFQQMQTYRIKPDKFTVVALLTGCAQVGALEQGKWIHEYMNEHRIVLDAVCGTALIDMYAKCGCIEKALEVFYGLQAKDTASWTSIICALSLNGKSGKALELFSEMTEFGFRPDDITFIGVLNACSHGGLNSHDGQKIDDWVTVGSDGRLTVSATATMEK